MKFNIQSISDREQGLKWAIFHIVLGIISAYFKYAFIIYFYIIFLNHYNQCLSDIRKGSIELFTLTISYLLGFELINRVVGGSPYVPAEFSKYFSVILWGSAAYLNKNRFNPLGTILLLFAIPCILYDYSGQVNWFDIVNSYLAPVGLAIGVGLWGSSKPTPDLISKTMRLVWFGCVTVLACMVVRTPNYEDINFGLSANMDTTGGTSSNQASTFLGLGMFLSFFSFYRKENFAGSRVFDIIFMMVFALQGLLTFSRGGILVGVLAIVFLILSPSQASDEDKDAKAKSKRLALNIMYLLIGLGFLVGAFILVDTLTGGLLSLRYQGETTGTAAGYAEKNLDKITTGRSEIFMYDVETWLEHPLLGVGTGASPYFRIEKLGFFVAPHVELSRLLADQGLLGLLYFIILIYLGYRIWIRRKIVPHSDLLIALYIIGMATSFHAAMRTFVTPFFIAYSSLALAPQLKEKEE